MTKEEAIKYLIQPIVNSTDIEKEKQKELNAYNIAIKTLEQKPKTGHWKRIETVSLTLTYCSECGFGQLINEYRIYNYCPSCGAKMVEPQENKEV